MHRAVTQHGHGRLVRDDGATQDIGGSTGGGSRRAIDDGVAPDGRQCLADSLDFDTLDYLFFFCRPHGAPQPASAE